jgi:hypothetical protein
MSKMEGSMRISFRRKIFYVAAWLAVSLATSPVYAATTGKLRCLGVKGTRGGTAAAMVIQVHNPNPETLSNVLKVTRIRQYNKDGVLTDSGAMTVTVGPNNTFENEISSGPSPMGSNAVEVSWSKTNDLAKRPIIQVWIYAEGQYGGVGFSATKCQ